MKNETTPMTLSPEAQAIVDAYENTIDKYDALAAALRAAADQARPRAHIEDINYVHQNFIDGWKEALYVILAIADELEAQ
jgi:hypothetical protein